MSERFAGIKEFLATVETGSFSAAAERLNLTGSAVGKSIARLEKRLDTRLFHRSTRKIMLTREGEVWLAGCLRMMEELEQAERLLSNEQQEPVGQVRLDLPATYGRHYLLPKLLVLAERYPKLKLNISFQDRLVDMLAENVDIAVRFGELGDLPGVIAKPIGSYRSRIAASPAYLARYGAPAHPVDLLQHDCIGASHKGAQAHWPLTDELGETVFYPILLKHEINDGDARLQAALAGCGLVLLPDWLLAPYVQSGQLAWVLGDFAEAAVPIHVMWQQRRHLQPKVRVVVEALQAAESYS